MANIKNSISCLNMFERAVQDPCSHGCDTEDDTILQEQNQDEMDELDPLKETDTSLNNIDSSDSDIDNNNNNNNNDIDTNDYITKKNTRGRSQNKDSDSGNIAPLIWNNPFGNGLDQYTDESPQQGMLLDKRKSSTFNGIPYNNNNNLAIRRTRTNSSCYIQQQSRKPIRNSTNSTRKSTSISTSNNNNNNKFLLQYRSKSNNNILKKNSSVVSDTPSIRSRSNTTNEFINNNNNNNNSINSKWVQPSSLSHSSCSSILSHLYGLEKYISSDLDALAAEDHKTNKIIPNLITFPNTNNSQSDLVFSNYTNTIPTSANTSTSANNTSEDFINGTKRQKSFIEQSLANSFSQ